ncbi:MAG: hypothetical protein QM808_13440 [Steroidobacteraceae bacterium]
MALELELELDEELELLDMLELEELLEEVETLDEELELERELEEELDRELEEALDALLELTEMLELLEVFELTLALEEAVLDCTLEVDEFATLLMLEAELIELPELVAALAEVGLAEPSLAASPLQPAAAIASSSTEPRLNVFPTTMWGLKLKVRRLGGCPALNSNSRFVSAKESNRRTTLRPVFQPSQCLTNVSRYRLKCCV